MPSKRRAKKQRKAAEEKMNKAVRAAAIYDEMNNTTSHHHSHHARRVARRIQERRYREKLMQCIFAPFVLALAIYIVLIVVTMPFGDTIDKIKDKAFTDTIPEFTQSIPLSESFAGSPEVSGIVTEDSIKEPETNNFFATIKCKKAGLKDVKIYYNGDFSALKEGVVTQDDSVLPGFTGKTEIYGYKAMYFKNLEKLAAGDDISIVTNYGTFDYEVTKVEKIGKNDIVETDENIETLVLKTDLYAGITEKQKSGYLCVYAKQISGPVLMK